MHFVIAPLLVPIATLSVTYPLDSEIQEILAGIPGHAACANPSDDDMRPYTLCLAENRFDKAKAEMERQLTITLTNVEAVRGARAAKRLAADQMKWAKRRERKCEKKWADSPVTQVARNTLACEAFLTEQRTDTLMALAVAEQPGRP